MIGPVIYSILSSAQAVAAICGNRIYPRTADQAAALPYVVYNQVSRVPNANKDRSRQVETYRVQVDCYAATYDQATALANATITALIYKTGTVGSTKVDIIIFENENDVYDQETDIYRKSQDFMIRIKP